MSGLEVVGAVASVVQLAQVVYEISKSLYEVGNALANASSDILDLAHDLELFSEELHLHATLVSAANHCYTQQVNRLTAKIIGRCATICGKIDRILKTLRTGGIYAKIRWLYKEKEIKKLLERLRDLKLSLLGTLSHLRSLEADHMMDALGYATSSLLKGAQDEEMSKETMADIEETRRKLMTLPMSVEIPVSVAARLSVKSTYAESRNPQAKEFQPRTASLATSSTQLYSIIPQSSDANKLKSGFSIPQVSDSPLFGNPRGLESKESFHSALSYPEYSPGEATNILPSQTLHERPNDATELQDGDWLSDLAKLGIKHLSMSPEEARTWALKVPTSSGKPSTGVQPVLDAGSMSSLVRRQDLDDPSLQMPSARFSPPSRGPVHFRTSLLQSNSALDFSYTSPAREPSQWLTQSFEENGDGANEFLHHFNHGQDRWFGGDIGLIEYPSGASGQISEELSFTQDSGCVWNAEDQMTPNDENFIIGAISGSQKQIQLEYRSSLHRGLDIATHKAVSSNVDDPHYHHGGNVARNARVDQLWWKAFLKMQEKDSTHYGALTAACHDFFSGKSFSDDAGLARAEVEDMPNQLQRVESMYDSNEPIALDYIALDSVLQDFDRIIEILDVVEKTVGFQTGALAWICLCAAIKGHLDNKQDADIAEHEAMFSAFLDVATLIARYAVMENIYQNWPGMSLEPKYEESLMSLCIQVLNLLEEALYNGDNVDSEEWTVAEAMAKINEADATCRGFKVTILQEQNTSSMDDVSEEENDSDGTLEELPSTKRRVEDLYGADSDSDSTEVGCNQKEVPIEEASSSKRLKL